MRITSTNRIDGRHCLTLAPEQPGEPSPPLRDLLVDASIIDIPGDRLAAVSALAYGPYLRGVVTAEQPISPRMLRALMAYQHPILFTSTEVSAEGAAPSGSGSTFVLDLDHRGYVGRNRVDRTQVIALDIMPMTTWTGRLFSMDRMVIASNADLLSQVRSRADPLGPYLAVALAFAHELHVSRIVLPTDEQLSSAWVDRATDLLAATGVDLVVTTTTDLASMDLLEERAI